ncbi:CAP domain-containing protein [Nonomuraea sp. NPDC059194]|uniref:CAP domain-containing protein n=1 Tax=Nonomuraea sp. NPDC059194 TaxID=3346764 RepID=UPI0036A42748
MTMKFAPGLIAAAAMGALTLSVPGTAGASTAEVSAPPVTSVADHPRPWGYYYSGNALAKARGKIAVRSYGGDDNTAAQVTFSLYDLDNRSATAGGSCAYVTFKALTSDTRWSDAYEARHCGGAVPRTLSFSVDGAKGLRVQVCQDGPARNGIGHCGYSETLFDLGRLDNRDVGMENEAIRLTNEARAAMGCKPATPDPRLRTAAVEHSADMSVRNYFSHASPDDRGAADRINASGFSPVSAWGENIAKGQTSAADVVKFWVNNPSDEANLMNCDLTHIGVGYAPSGDYWTLLLVRH